MILDVEVQLFQRERPVLLAQKGKYVLIQGEQILGVWPTYRDALTAGYQQCGLDKPFLVRQILERDDTQYFV